MEKLYAVNKRVQNAVLVYNLKNDRMISVHFQGKPFNIRAIQVYASATNAKEAEICTSTILFRRNGVAIMVNKRVRNALLGCNLKNDTMISVPFQRKPFHISYPSLCPNQ